MKGAAISLIVGTVLVAVWFLGLPSERNGFRDIGLLFAGTIFVITGLLLAALTAVERPRCAKAEVAPAPKVLFPLVSFIFAALFIVILGPAIISIMINLRT
jgi:hypothetical protein